MTPSPDNQTPTHPLPTPRVHGEVTVDQSTHSECWEADRRVFTPVGAAQAHAFEILSELGRGAMGVVYRARDLTAGREVALKVVQAPQGSASLERFRREGVLTAGMDHQHVVKLHFAGDVDGRPFLAYELVEGCRTLDEAFADSDRLAGVALVRDAAGALGYAHWHGIVHRDVKPGNVLVDREGRVRVADFGLATAAHLERLTLSGALVGTPSYMSPEQLAGESLKPAPGMDVWALGVILYELLCGRLPFVAGSLVELAAIVHCGQPTRPSEIDPSVPADLEAVCLKALRANPSERYSNARAFAEDLDRFLEGLAVSAQTARPSLWTIAACLGVVALGVAWILLPTDASPKPDLGAQSHIDVAEEGDDPPFSSVDREWEVGVALASRTFERDPVAALAHLQRLPDSDDPRHGAELAARALERAQALLPQAGERIDPDATRDLVLCCRIARRLRLRTPLPDALVDGLLTQATRFDATTPFVLDVAELAPGNGRVQRALSGRILVVRNPSHKRRLLGVVTRALELTEDASGRRELRVLLCDQLAAINDSGWRPDLEEARRSIELADALLIDLEDPLQRARLLVARSRARRLLGDLDRSLDDIDSALALRPNMQTAAMFRAFTLAALGRRREAVEEATRFMLRNLDGTHENSRTLSIAWDLRQPDQDARVLQTLEQFLSTHSNYGGWWARMALLQLRAGDAPAALRSLERGRTTFAHNGDLHFPAGARRLAGALEALRRDAETALPKLKALVDDLDAKRGGGFEP